MRGRAWRRWRRRCCSSTVCARSPTPSRPASPRTASGGSPFVTWRELSALHASGAIDVQSHTDSHSRIFASADVEDFVQPGYETTPLLNRPQLVRAAVARVRDAGRSRHAALRHAIADVGRPPRARVAARSTTRCVELVAREGGAGVLHAARLARTAHRHRRSARRALEFESADDQARAIEEELARSRSILNERLRTQSVAHICLPWGISGDADRGAAQAHRLSIRVRQPPPRPTRRPRRRRSVLAEAAAEALHHASARTRPPVLVFMTAAFPDDVDVAIVCHNNRDDPGRDARVARRRRLPSGPHHRRRRREHRRHRRLAAHGVAQTSRSARSRANDGPIPGATSASARRRSPSCS